MNIDKITIRDCAPENNFFDFLKKSFDFLHPGQGFVDSWYIHYLCEYLRHIELGKIRRLIINIPPRCMKSICFSVAWPAWLLGNDPRRKIICASYCQALSYKHSEDCNFTMSSDWYRKLFPRTHILKKFNRKSKFITSNYGMRLSVSIEGRLTGEGADFIILDDPQTPAQAHSPAFRERLNTWYQRTLISRLNDRLRGVIVIVMQRLHHKDLISFVTENKMDNFHIVTLPMLATKDESFAIGDMIYNRKRGEMLSDRFTNEDINNLKREMGHTTFEIQYQQNISVDSSTIIRYEWIMRFGKDDEVVKSLTNNLESSDVCNGIFQSWDCANKTGDMNDYSVCTTWHLWQDELHLIHMYRSKIDYPTLKKSLRALLHLFRPEKVFIEDHAAGQQILQEFKRDCMYDMTGVRARYSKIARATISSSMFADGRIKIPENEKLSSYLFSIATGYVVSSRSSSAIDKRIDNGKRHDEKGDVNDIAINYHDWIDEFVNEMCEFPYAPHDDIVDSTTQMILSLKEVQERRAHKTRRDYILFDTV